MGILAQDTFAGRTNSGTWNTASDGHTWAMASGNIVLSVGSNEGKAHGNNTPTTMLLGSGTATDQEGLVRFSPGQANDSNGLVLRSDNAGSNYYMAETGFFTNDIGIYKVVSGTRSNLDLQVCGFTVTAGSFYWMRFQVIGTTLKAKIWADGSSEPGTWQSTITDATFASGQYGIHAYSFGAVDAQYDSYQANDTSAAKPLVTQAEARFFVQAKLQTQARAKFFVRLKLATIARSTFLVRLALEAIARATFPIRAKLVSSSQAKFSVRAKFQIQARSKFLIRLTLATTARAKFVTRYALKTLTRSKFLINQAISPIKQLKISFTSKSKYQVASFISQGKYKLTFSEAAPMTLPNSTTQTSTTVTDASGNPQATMTGTVSVSFPDGTSSGPLTPTNAGAGVYTLSYTTKGTGLIRELWSFTDGSGNTLTDENVLVCAYSH